MSQSSQEYGIEPHFAIIAKSKFELMKKISKRMSESKEFDDSIATVVEVS